ncbi:eukaryotic translation initiation factor 4E-2-like [Argentina anserina]|uniref:eukaryotic translation initiation factor 4E-2-like n=1 Tax=Argentina anserina TaxID=57926 RepID=UPI00217672ED|nr:eukaryotic translation initiation factor 4E-2-like [Potentilla anserina]
MVSFSSLGGSSRLAKERAEAFLRKNPKLPYTAATSVAQVLGFPYNIIPELPAVLRYLRKLWSLPGWLCSLILKKKQVTKRAAAEIFTRSLITLGPKETASAHSWTFWVGRSATPGSICPVYTFTTVEGFWSFYNNMCQPSQLTPGFDFYFFKDNIEPKWEGEESVHAEGGKWTLSFSRGESNFPWQQTLQALVNEQFHHRHDVCGAVVNIRDEQEKISLWTKNAANENAQLSIGKQWKGFLDIKETIGYTVHVGANEEDSSAENIYTV